MPRLWVYVGDMISTEGRRLAEQRFGVMLYSVYAAIEAGTIGFQCERRASFHLNLDLCATRLIDEEGRTVAPGESGEVVISGLDNRAMVLLNYRLGDRARLDPEPCPCGRTLSLLSRLEGRRSETIRLADGRQLTSLHLESVFAAELGQTLQAQVEQLEPGRLRWRVVPIPDSDRGELRRAFEERSRLGLGPDTRLEVDFVESISLTPDGKFRRSVVRQPGAPAQAAVAAS